MNHLLNPNPEGKVFLLCRQCRLPGVITPDQGNSLDNLNTVIATTLLQGV